VGISRPNFCIFGRKFYDRKNIFQPKNLFGGGGWKVSALPFAMMLLYCSNTVAHKMCNIHALQRFSSKTALEIIGFNYCSERRSCWTWFSIDRFLLQWFRLIFTKTFNCLSCVTQVCFTFYASCVLRGCWMLPIQKVARFFWRGGVCECCIMFSGFTFRNYGINRQILIRFWQNLQRGGVTKDQLSEYSDFGGNLVYDLDPSFPNSNTALFCI